jgi:predicted transcriptional regulator
MKGNNRKQPVNIRLSPETLHALSKACVTENNSRGRIIERAVRKELKIEDSKR